MSFSQYYPAGIVADADGVIIDQTELPGEDQMSEAMQLDHGLRQELRREFEEVRERFDMTDKRALDIAKKRVSALVASIIADEADDLGEDWKAVPLPGME